MVPKPQKLKPSPRSISHMSICKVTSPCAMVGPSGGRPRTHSNERVKARPLPRWRLARKGSQRTSARLRSLPGSEWRHSPGFGSTVLPLALRHFSSPVLSRLLNSRFSRSAAVFQVGCSSWFPVWFGNQHKSKTNLRCVGHYATLQICFTFPFLTVLYNFTALREKRSRSREACFS